MGAPRVECWGEGARNRELDYSHRLGLADRQPKDQGSASVPPPHSVSCNLVLTRCAGCLISFTLEAELPELTGPRVISDVLGGRDKVKFVEVSGSSGVMV